MMKLCCPVASLNSISCEQQKYDSDGNGNLRLSELAQAIRLGLKMKATDVEVRNGFEDQSRDSVGVQ